ncbi:hypothetical protein BDF21DRAFT_461677 [Thamnidium elegans]|nr:hypothetical protein BDF21DRAFT_461677 [Thamnidium elegans]
MAKESSEGADGHVRFKMDVASDYKAEFSIYTARLKNIWFHLMAMQAATCIYGWIIQIGASLPAALAIQFVFAFNCSGVTSTCQTLLVDLFPVRDASIIASNNLMRCILGAAATAYIEPAIQGVGMGWVFTILVGLSGIRGV